VPHLGLSSPLACFREPLAEAQVGSGAAAHDAASAAPLPPLTFHAPAHVRAAHVPACPCACVHPSVCLFVLSHSLACSRAPETDSMAGPCAAFPVPSAGDPAWCLVPPPPLGRKSNETQ
jgi:hypothetical protein